MRHFVLMDKIFLFYWAINKTGEIKLDCVCVCVCVCKHTHKNIPGAT